METLNRIFIFAGGLSGCAGVALGALTAHAFRARFDAAGLASLETAAAYLLVHGLLLVAIASLGSAAPGALSLRVAGVLAIAGIILFCGGLSISVVSGVHAFAAAAPGGGLAFMGAWLALAVFALTRA